MEDAQSTIKRKRLVKKPCFDFLDGRCERGDDCMYRHVSLSECSSKHRENFEISKSIYGKTFKTSDEKLAQIMKLPVSYRQRARRMFFGSTTTTTPTTRTTTQ